MVWARGMTLRKGIQGHDPKGKEIQGHDPEERN
jgi:hypothetical protein